MSCLILTKRGEKNRGRSQELYGALSLLEKEGLQIVSVSDIKDYKEYEPAIEIKSLAESLLNDLAEKDFADISIRTVLVRFLICGQ